MPEKLVLNPLLSRKSGATEIYLIRHADALPGPETVIPGGGYDDQPLSQLGQQQALALANWLAQTNFDALYSSPLRRTRETAAPLAQVQDKEVTLEAGLREVKLNLDVASFVEGEGPAATSNALRSRMDEIVRQVGREGKWSAIPGSEQSESFRARVVSIIQQLAARHAGQRLAVFSHGGVINAYLAEALNLERDFFFPIYNTSVSMARVLENQVAIFSLNDIAHLRAANVELEV